ncbi:MAG TPA: CsbD family protein [Thermoanaerobaculia bacterium]
MPTNRNEVEGRGRKLIGSIKEKLGRATGNDDLEVQGSAERTAGGFQAGVGKVTRKVTDALDDAGRDLNRKP